MTVAHNSDMQGVIPSQAASTHCPHSHLPFEFLKKIGKAVEHAGAEAVQAAIEAALSNLGAFGDQ